MIIKFMKKNFLLKIFSLITLWILFIVAINIYVLSFSRDNLYTQVSQVPKNEVWLVFWASVINNSYPSDILKDRLTVAIEAYNQGKISQIIVSWDNSKKDYNEPEVMRKYLISQWVDNAHIHLDYAGFDTYDSLYRAKKLFKVDSITLFTQDFHLKRALYIAARLWIQGSWVSTNLQVYLMDSYNDRREVLARVKAFLDVEIFASKPKFLGDDLKIYPLEEIEKIKQELNEEK